MSIFALKDLPNPIWNMSNKEPDYVYNHSSREDWVKIGKSENTVSRWCANKVQPSITQLNEIATILDVDVRSLICSTK